MHIYGDWFFQIGQSLSVSQLFSMLVYIHHFSYYYLQQQQKLRLSIFLYVPFRPPISTNYRRCLSGTKSRKQQHNLCGLVGLWLRSNQSSIVKRQVSGINLVTNPSRTVCPEWCTGQGVHAQCLFWDQENKTLCE